MARLSHANCAESELGLRLVLEVTAITDLQGQNIEHFEEIWNKFGNNLEKS